jgi:hypothetical protein
VSAYAFEQMTGVPGDVRLINVATLREVTRALAHRTGVTKIDDRAAAAPGDEAEGIPT